MKKKITKIWGVGLAVVLVASLLSFAAPVSAGTLGWSSEVLPSTSGEVLEDVDIVDFGVSADGTIWAGGGSTLLYKSTDTGVSWTASTPKPATETDLVAVAPDNSDVVAYWSSTNTSVFVTVNGGTTWGDLGTPQEASEESAASISAIAISAESAGTNYVAVAGDETTSGDANVWYFNVGAAAPAWKETNDVSGFTAGETAGAVAFSPNFASDQVMVTVTANATANTVHFQMFSMNQLLWNDPTFASYPVSVLASIASPSFSGLDSASIVLAPDYLGSDDVTRIAFVGLALATDTTSEGIYRLKDVATPKQVSASEPIHSVAFNGTNVVAGRYDNNRVRYSDDPLATTPTFTSSAALKSPGLDTTAGTEKTVVAWAGADVVAGTSENNSAFAISMDNGKSFNDISLIDTTLTEIEDVAVAADGSAVYFISNDVNSDTSVWRLTDSWQRVLVIDNNEDFVLRLAPDDPDVVFAADTGSGAQTIYFSTNGGAEKWFTRTFRYSDGIQDMAVEGDGDVAYVALYGKDTVSTTTNSGFTWASAASTKLAGGSIYTIVSVAEDQLLVGSTTGYVSYSTDGNASWTKLAKVIETGASNLQVTANSLDSGGFIYAASGTAASNFRRWEIDTSTSWSDIISGTMATGYSAFGIGLSDAGTMYVLASDGEDTSVYRALSPSTSTSGSTWSTKGTIAADNVSVSATPSALRISSGSFKLWSVATFDTGGTTEAAKVYSFTDTISEAGPTLNSPADGTEIAMNPVSGKAYDATFTWERPSSYVTAYDLQVALDADFTEVAKTVSAYDPVGDPATVSKIVGPGDASLEYMPGITYYWRVRVSSAGPVYSPYSEVRSFAIAELVVTPPVEIVIPPPAPAPEVVIPEIVIPDIVIPEIVIPPVVIPPAPAPPEPITPAYIWAVIIIGAILVIAVIVLIVRTRRPV